jgi:hypothetical protein
MRLACPEERLDCLPISEVKLNLECRDEIIPILRALQHLYADDSLRRELLALVGKDVNGDTSRKHGRRGMNYWEITVLAAARLGCNLDYDKLQDLAENHRSAAGFVVDYRVVEDGRLDQDLVVPVMKKLQKRFDGKIKSASFDRGFHTPRNQEDLAEIVPTPCIAAKGPDQGRQQHKEGTVAFRQARQNHPGVESVIGALQKGNGLKRSRVRSKKGYERYVALGILGRLRRSGRQSDASADDNRGPNGQRRLPLMMALLDVALLLEFGEQRVGTARQGRRREQRGVAIVGSVALGGGSAVLSGTSSQRK